MGKQRGGLVIGSTYIHTYIHTHIHTYIHTYIHTRIYQEGTRFAVAWGTAQQTGRSFVRISITSLGFFIDMIPGADSDSNRNEYQEYLLGCKDGRWVKLTTLSPSCAACVEIWGPQLAGYFWSEVGLYRDCCTFTFTHTHTHVYMCVCV